MFSFGKNERRAKVRDVLFPGGWLASLGRNFSRLDAEWTCLLGSE